MTELERLLEESVKCGIRMPCDREAVWLQVASCGHTTPYCNEHRVMFENEIKKRLRWFGLVQFWCSDCHAVVASFEWRPL